MESDCAADDAAALDVGPGCLLEEAPVPLPLGWAWDLDDGKLHFRCRVDRMTEEERMDWFRGIQRKSRFAVWIAEEEARAPDKIQFRKARGYNLVGGSTRGKPRQEIPLLEKS